MNICHSPEVALVKVRNYLLLTVPSFCFAVLVLLDLIAALETVDHNILLSHFDQYVGIAGMALKRFQSYLSDRILSSWASILQLAPR